MCARRFGKLKGEGKETRAIKQFPREILLPFVNLAYRAVHLTQDGTKARTCFEMNADWQVFSKQREGFVQLLEGSAIVESADDDVCLTGQPPEQDLPAGQQES